MKRPRESEEEIPSSTQDISQFGETALNKPLTSVTNQTRPSSSSPRARTASPALSSSTPANNEYQRQTTSPEDEPRSKIIELDLSSETTDGNINDDDEEDGYTNNTMKCSLPGHKFPIRFTSYEEYENHYTKNHTNQCRECRKNFPSEHLLGLHIEEVHDSFVAVMRDRGDKTFSCFVETCDRKFGDAAKRNRHLRDKHLYPRNYFFLVTTVGIDGRTSMLNEEPRWKKNRQHQKKPWAEQTSTAGKTPEAAADGPATTTGTEPIRGDHPGATKPDEAATTVDNDEDRIELDPVVDETVPKGEREREPIDVEMDDLAGAMSSLRFIPPAIRFGRGRKGFAKH